jgi:hypothetical protein
MTNAASSGNQNRYSIRIVILVVVLAKEYKSSPFFGISSSSCVS